MKYFIISLALSISDFVVGQYCHPATENLFSHHQIQYFEFGDLVNITSNEALSEYNDYSESMVINVRLDEEYEFIMSKGPDPYVEYRGNTLGYSIWIDFNNDMIFSDLENIYSHYDPTTNNYFGSVTFTDASLSGARRLRVRNEWGSAPESACDDIHGGETEDYTIFFDNTVGLDDESNDEYVSVFPNPSEGLFNLQMDGAINNVTLELMDLSGRLVNRIDLQSINSIYSFSIDGPKGLYILSVKSDTYNGQFKLIKR